MENRKKEAIILSDVAFVFLIVNMREDISNRGKIVNKEKRVIICMVIVTMLSGGCAGTRNDVSTENEISTDADNNVVTAEELSTGGAWEEKHGYYEE